MILEQNTEDIDHTMYVLNDNIKSVKTDAFIK